MTAKAIPIPQAKVNKKGGAGGGLAVDVMFDKKKGMHTRDLMRALSLADGSGAALPPKSPGSGFIFHVGSYDEGRLLPGSFVENVLASAGVKKAMSQKAQPPAASVKVPPPSTAVVVRKNRK